MKNTIIYTVVSILLIVGFLFAAYKFTGTPATPTLFPEVSKLAVDDHIKWSKQKKHILVEYSDIQCPACKNFHDYIVQDLETTRSGQIDVTKNITFVFRHFPLSDIHEHAQEAAWAAEAASMQGKFFEYTDALFDSQTEWEKLPDVKNYFISVAKELKLDTDKFAKDMSSDAVKNRVERDYKNGIKFQVNATPTFYLDGKKIDNIRSFEEFRKTLEDASLSSK